MIIVYIIVGFVVILMAACSFTPFFSYLNNSILIDDEKKAANSLESAPVHIKNACKYSCPQCGNKLLPDENGMDIRCYKCGHLWHPDYILTVYEDNDFSKL